MNKKRKRREIPLREVDKPLVSSLIDITGKMKDVEEEKRLLERMISRHESALVKLRERRWTLESKLLPAYGVGPRDEVNLLPGMLLVFENEGELAEDLSEGDKTIMNPDASRLHIPHIPSNGNLLDRPKRL